jgi:5-(carboxyamino)imidazole ribonucleotide mutase
MPNVGIVIGSASDTEFAEKTSSVLDEFGISNEIVVASAHRTPQKVKDYVQSATQSGTKVFIAQAGGSAGLPGCVASWTNLPVIGVPLTSSDLNGVDSLYSIAQMPPGIPVAAVAIGSWGARNAAYFAAQIISLFDEDVKNKYDKYRDDLSKK